MLCQEGSATCFFQAEDKCSRELMEQLKRSASGITEAYVGYSNGDSNGESSGSGIVALWFYKGSVRMGI